MQHLEEEGRLNGGVVREAGAQWVDNRRGTIAEVPGGRESRAGSGVTQAAQAGVGAVGRHLHGDLHVGAGGATAPGHLQQPAQQHCVWGYPEVEEPGAAIPAVESQLLWGLRKLLRHQPGICGEGAVSRARVPRIPLPWGEDGGPHAWPGPERRGEGSHGAPGMPGMPTLTSERSLLPPSPWQGPWAQKFSLRHHVPTHVHTSIFLNPSSSANDL